MSSVLISGFSFNTQVGITIAVCCITYVAAAKAKRKTDRLNVSIALALCALSVINIKTCYSFSNPINNHQISQLSKKIEYGLAHKNGSKFKEILAQYANNTDILSSKSIHKIKQDILKANLTKKEWQEIFELAEKLGIY